LEYWEGLKARPMDRAFSPRIRGVANTWGDAPGCYGFAPLALGIARTEFAVGVQFHQPGLDAGGRGLAVGQVGGGNEFAPHAHAGERLGQVEFVPALPQPPGRREFGSDQQDRRLGAAGDDQGAGLDLVDRPLGSVGGDAHVLALAQDLHEGRGRLAAELVARAAHGLQADQGEKRVEPGAVLARADEGVHRPALAVAAVDERGEEQAVVPEHHGDRFVALGEVGDVLLRLVEPQARDPRAHEQRERPHHQPAPAGDVLHLGLGVGTGRGRVQHGVCRAIARPRQDRIARRSD